MTGDCKDLKERYREQAATQWLGEPDTGTLAVVMSLYFGSRRTHDIDNYNKLVLDALSGICYLDDGQIQLLTISKHYDKLCRA